MVGILLAVADWLYFSGLACPDVPVSAVSLMRRFSVVITFFLGAKFFHETNLVRKAIALAIVVAGITLICLGKPGPQVANAHTVPAKNSSNLPAH